MTSTPLVKPSTPELRAHLTFLHGNNMAFSLVAQTVIFVMAGHCGQYLCAAETVKYFRETMNEEGHGVGKKLGFIAQEMGREINTTGSTNDQD